MQIALGRSVADEHKPGIHKLSKVCILIPISLKQCALVVVWVNLGIGFSFSVAIQDFS